MRIRASFIGVVSMAAVTAAMVGGCNKRVELGPVADAASAKSIREAFAVGQAAGGEKAAVKATGTGWATLRGQFVYDGTPPEQPPYSVTKEADVCTVGGKAPPQETL